MWGTRQYPTYDDETVMSGAPGNDPGLKIETWGTQIPLIPQRTRNEWGTRLLTSHPCVQGRVAGVLRRGA